MRNVWVAVVVCVMAGQGYGAWNLDMETGQVSAGYNDIKIPGDTGTRFSLTDSFSVDRKMYYRIRVNKELKNHKYLSVLYAPLSLDAHGVTDGVINYNNDVFPANTAVSARYRFDSYRITYGKYYPKNDALTWKLGFTAKIRDAAISITGNGITSEKKNTGLVPLLNFGARYVLNERTALIFDADALAGGPGRAEDVMLALAHTVSPGYTFRVGYRIVEGGSDTTQVYNFALLSYLVIGLTISL